MTDMERIVEELELLRVGTRSMEQLYNEAIKMLNHIETEVKGLTEKENNARLLH